jgi:hypothetical protein
VVVTLKHFTLVAFQAGESMPMSLVSMFETCRKILRMSVYPGRPEVMSAGSNGAIGGRLPNALTERITTLPDTYGVIESAPIWCLDRTIFSNESLSTQAYHVSVAPSLTGH